MPDDVVIRERVAGLTATVTDLINWQKAQNGTVSRIEAKLDKLIFWMLTLSVGILASILAGVVLFLVKR